MFFFRKSSSKKTPLFLAIAFVIGLAGGGIASLFANPYVEGSVSFFVRNERHAADAAYDYEGYYTLKTADEAASALANWLRSPGGAEAVYAQAGVALDIKNLRSYERIFDVRHSATPFFEVRFKARSYEEARRIASAIEKNVESELVLLQGKTSALSLGSTAPVLVERPVALMRNLLYGGVLTMVLAVFVLLSRSALLDKPH